MLNHSKIDSRKTEDFVVPPVQKSTKRRKRKTKRSHKNHKISEKSKKKISKKQKMLMQVRDREQDLINHEILLPHMSDSDYYFSNNANQNELDKIVG